MPPSILVMTDILSTMNNINTSAAAERADNQRDQVAAPGPVDCTADVPPDNSRDNTPHPESKQSSPVIQNGSIDIDEEEDVANRDDNHDNNIPTTYFLPRGKLTKPTVVQPPKPGGK